MSAVNYEVYDETGGGGGGTGTTSRSTASGTSTSRQSGSSSSSTSRSGSTSSTSGSTARSTSDSTVVTTGRGTGGTTRYINSRSFYFKDVPSDWKITMNPGETLELHLQVSSSSRPVITFESSNTMVASVVQTGIVVCKVTARGIGVCTVKASYTNATSGVYYEAELTVAVGSVDIDFDSIQSDHKIWMAIREEKLITIRKTDPTSITVESSDPSIATFTKTSVTNAVLKAISPGVCVIRYIKDRQTVIDSYYVIVTHGNGTNYLDVITFEKTKTWESLNLGSIFVVGCSEEETSGQQGATFRSNIFSPDKWRDLIERSYKEVKVSKLGQEISIKVTPPTCLEDEDSENAWIDSLSAISTTSTETDSGEEETTTTETDSSDIYCNFVGIGVYKFLVSSNCPVRFKVSSDKISLGPWTGEVRSDYILSDFGNSRILPVHVLDLPLDGSEVIDFSYECIDGRDHHDFKLKLWPALPGLVDSRGPYIYIVPGESYSYNQKISLKAYGDIQFSGIEYPRQRDYYRKSEEDLATMWVSELSAADNSISGLRISITTEPHQEQRTDDPGLLKYFITLRSVTGYKCEDLPTAPVARIKFSVSGDFEPVNITVKNYIYYYIYVLPAIPSKNADTYEMVEERLDNVESFNIGYSIFERLRTEDLSACWPGTSVKFIDISGMYDCFSVKYPDNYANVGTRNDWGVSLDIAWTDTALSWNSRPWGSELGTLVIKWYFNKNYILEHDGLFNYYYLSEGFTTIGEAPYTPNDQFYTQTVHFIKGMKGNGYTGHITNLDDVPTNYSALGTYNPVTLEPEYQIIKTDLTFNATHPTGHGYYTYKFREEEISDAVPIKYKCEQSQENKQNLNLTIEPRGNNASFSLGNYEELIPYYSVAKGEIKLLCEGTSRSDYGNRGSSSYSTVLDTYSFTQEGLEDCILYKDKIYLGRAEINLPDIDYTSYSLKIGGYGIKSYRIADIVNNKGDLSRIREIDDGITIKVWKDSDPEPFWTETASSFNNIDAEFPENRTSSEIIYTIEVKHRELPSSVSSSDYGFESTLLLRLKQKTKSSDIYLNTNTLPAIYSYGQLESPIVFYTTIPKNKIWVEEVLRQDSNGKWVVGEGTTSDFRIDAYTPATPDPDAPAGYRCYKCQISFSPNSRYIPTEDSSSYLGEDTIRKIRIRHLDIDEGEIYDLKQGYYTIYPTLMYKGKDEDQDLTFVTEKDSRNGVSVANPVFYNKEEGFWQIGSEYNPLNLPPFRNAGGNLDPNKVWISLMAMQHEVSYGDTVRWVNTTRLFNKGALEIETNSRELRQDTVDRSIIANSQLSESDWFNSIQTDIIIRSSDKTSAMTKEIIGSIPGEDTEKEGKPGKEDIEFPALETIYTASGAGFYERQVLIREEVELGLGVLTDQGDIFYEGRKAYTVNSKIQIWYRKIGEDIKDE